jgi:hypothetical protein
VRTKAIILRVALVCDHDDVLFEADPEVKQWADPPGPGRELKKLLGEKFGTQHQLELRCGQCDWSGIMHFTAIQMRELSMTSHQGEGTFIISGGL